MTRTPTAELALVRRFPAWRGCRGTRSRPCPHPCSRSSDWPGAATSARCGSSATIASGPLYGGNKPRKLEWLLGAARRAGGAASSPSAASARITAWRRRSAPATRGCTPCSCCCRNPLPITSATACCSITRSAPSCTSPVGRRRRRRRGAPVRRRRCCAAARSRSSRPAAASATGAIGYVNAACELADQVRAGAMPEPDAIFVPLGSGGTVAGLALGCRLAGLRSRVVAVLVTDILPPSPARLAGLARGACAACGALAPECRRCRCAPRTSPSSASTSAPPTAR